MIFANPAYGNDHNIDKPPIGHPYESVRKPWDNIGLYHYNEVLRQVYCPIGTRLLATIGHIGSWVGQPIQIQGITVHVTEVIQSENVGDLDFCKVDTDIPYFFPRLRAASSFTNLNNMLVIGGGIGVDQHLTDGEGWMYVTRGSFDTIALRWGINKADLIGIYNPYPPNPAQDPPPPGTVFGALFRHHDEGHPESVECSTLDSGSAVFLDCGSGADLWVYVGPVGGGGHDYLSPYKGNVQTGYAGPCVLFDEEYIDYLNGVVPIPPGPIIPPEPGPPDPPPLPPSAGNPPRGTIIDLADFAGTTLPLSMQVTSGTASWYVANGKISVSGYSGTLLNDRVEFVDIYTADEDWVYELDLFAPSVITDTPSGAFIGMQSSSSLARYSAWAGVDFSKTANGTMRIYVPDASTIVRSSSIALGIASAGSPLRLTFRRSRASLIFTVTNLASYAIKTITVRYPETIVGVANHPAGLYPPSIGRPAISTGGGAWSINAIRFTSATRIRPRAVVLGDSMSCGLTGGVLGGGAALRWTDYAQVQLGDPIAVYAGSGDGYAEANTRIHEALALDPEKVVIAVGSDDILLRGMDIQGALALLNALRASISFGGAKPMKIMTPLPCGTDPAKANELAGLAEAIVANYPAEAIDVYSLCANGAGAMLPEFTADGRHPNPLGHQVIGRHVSALL